MFTMTMLMFCLVVAVVVLLISIVGGLILGILGLSMAILATIVVWALRIAFIVLLVKAGMERPVKAENFVPAIVALVLSMVIGWIF